jgi:ribonuclease R
MAKATYSTQNVGHYGLAFKHYTHFTSPIRRYPDMMVHRLLERYLSGGRSVAEQQTEEACKHCSDMESLAVSAERSSIKYKQVEFMADKVGMIFDGVVSGVTEWGLYVELTNACEGMVPIRDLADDYYEYDEKTYSLIGTRKKQRYCLGDALKVKVTKANLDRKQLDFTLAE